MKVEVISTETIKPSSPTPHHLQHYQLSFLDQISPPVYMPLTFFYQADDEQHVGWSNAHKSDRLKSSLSDTLARFYPLAGRLRDNAFIHCNDEGIPYSEARCIQYSLAEIVKNPVPGDINALYPREADKVDDTVLAIQVTFFDCGGMAISVCLSHQVADATSMVMFITSWAAAARGDTDIPYPIFGSAKLFPPLDNLSGFLPSTGITKDNIVTKRYVFSHSVVAALRDKYTACCSDNTADTDPIRPTRVEALSAFIWTRFAAATAAEPGQLDSRLYTLLHAVNLRTRIVPPLPEYSFGNLSRIAIATPSMEEGRDYGGGHLVRQMRAAIQSIDSDYVVRLQEGGEHLSFIKEIAKRFTRGELVSLNFTSLCRLPLYETDFGWGRPARVGSGMAAFKNLVSFMESREGDDGIEAWINLGEEDMAKFEVDEELLANINACV